MFAAKLGIKGKIYSRDAFKTSDVLYHTVA